MKKILHLLLITVLIYFLFFTDYKEYFNCSTLNKSDCSSNDECDYVKFSNINNSKCVNPDLEDKKCNKFSNNLDICVSKEGCGVYTDEKNNNYCVFNNDNVPYYSDKYNLDNGYYTNDISSLNNNVSLNKDILNKNTFQDKELILTIDNLENYKINPTQVNSIDAVQYNLSSVITDNVLPENYYITISPNDLYKQSIDYKKNNFYFDKYSKILTIRGLKNTYTTSNAYILNLYKLI